MAAKVSMSILPETTGGWLGWAAALVLAGFTAVTQFRKVKVDEQSAATHMWESLTKAHTAQIEALSERVSSLEKDMAAMRLAHADEIAEMKKAHADELRKRDEDIVQLQRIIAQNSQSTAYRMGDPGGTAVTRANRKRRGDEE